MQGPAPIMRLVTATLSCSASLHSPAAFRRAMASSLPLPAPAREHKDNRQKYAEITRNLEEERGMLVHMASPGGRAMAPSLQLADAAKPRTASRTQEGSAGVGG